MADHDPIGVWRWFWLFWRWFWTSTSPELDDFLYAEGGWLLDPLGDELEILLEGIVTTLNPYKRMHEVTSCTKVIHDDFTRVPALPIRHRRRRQ